MRVEPERRSVRLRIEGLVQGVGYRAFVEREAGRIGLVWRRALVDRWFGLVDINQEGAINATLRL